MKEKLNFHGFLLQDPGKFYWSRKLPTFKKWFTTSDIKNKREDIAHIIKKVATRDPKTRGLAFPEIRFSRRSGRHARAESPIDIDNVEGYTACGEEKKAEGEGQEGVDNVEDGELREAEAEAAKSKAMLENLLKDKKLAKKRQAQSKKKKEKERNKEEGEKKDEKTNKEEREKKGEETNKEEEEGEKKMEEETNKEEKKKRLQDMMISSEESQSPIKQVKVQLERLPPPMPVTLPPLKEEVLSGSNWSEEGDIEGVKEKKVKKSKNIKKKSKRKRRCCLKISSECFCRVSRPRKKSDDSSKEEVDLSLSSCDSSPYTSKKKNKKYSRDRQRSSSNKQVRDKKGRKDSQSLEMDPTDLRLALNSLAARTIAKALSSLGESTEYAGRKRQKKSVAVSNDDGRDNSNSFFHTTKSVRQVERVVEMERQSSSESLNRTNPFSNAAEVAGWRSGKQSLRNHKSGNEDSALKEGEMEPSSGQQTRGSSSGRHRSPLRWKESSKGRGKFKSGPVRKFCH